VVAENDGSEVIYVCGFCGIRLGREDRGITKLRTTIVADSGVYCTCVGGVMEKRTYCAPRRIDGPVHLTATTVLFNQ
jgi:hypothetical protein